MSTLKMVVVLLLGPFSFLPAHGDSRRTEFVYVNGGYDEFSNYSIHEKDLLSFRDNVFKNGKVTLFNAGGPNTPVLNIRSDGSFERNSAGRIVFNHSKIAGTEKATHFNIAKFFEKLSKPEKPDAVTIVWGDHGEENGVALWDGSTLSASDIRKMYAKVPKSTVIRAIHIHCYSGAAMSGADSPFPLKDEANLKALVESKFPSNVCGLSVSDVDEVGQYRSWTETGWNKDLKEKSLSLVKLKGLLLKDPNVYPSIMLTSDYFLRDLKNGICEEWKDKPDEKIEGQFCEKCRTTKVLNLSKEILELKKKLCTHSDIDRDAIDAFKAFNDAYSELGYAEYQLMRDYIKARHPAFYADLKKSLVEVDKIQEKIARETDEQKEQSLVKQLEKVRSDFPAGYSRYQLEIKNTVDFQNYFSKNFNEKWINDHKKQVPNLGRSIKNSKFRNYFINTNPSKFKRDVGRLRDEYAKNRAQSVEHLNSLRASMTGILFSDPNLISLKERYESILKCEEGSLN